MITKISQSDREREFERLVSQQFDAFEKQERLIKAEEREERARQLRLPLDRSKKAHRPEIRLLENS
jgi:hypothetical protein